MRSDPKTVIGVDLGGTFIRVGIIDPASDHLLTFVEAPIHAHQGPGAGIDRMISVIEAAISKSGRLHIDGIGIGATGPVDRSQGLIQNPYTLPGWEDVNIFIPIKERFGVPVVLENDADAAALGEYWIGAGRGIRRLYMITVGTGIGTACIYDGEVYRGLDGAHPDGGHQVLDPEGPECYCGARGCWESLSSGSAIGVYAQEHLYQHPESLLNKIIDKGDSRIDARLVAASAGQGDLFALSVLERAAFYFSLGVVNVITLFVPEVILLGGGVMKSSQFFIPQLEKTIAAHNIMVPATRVSILPTQLGVQAGVAGAAYAVLCELKGKQ